MKKLIPTLVLASMASIANAESPTGVYIPFGIMGYDYDDSVRALDTNGMPTLGIGYRLDQHWATELMIADGDTDVDIAGGGDADVRHYRLDSLYFLDDMNGLTPYVVAGLGENRIDYDLAGTTEDTLFNAGAGLLYQVNGNFALRGDVRAIHSLDEDNTEAAVNLLALFSFGAGSAAVATNNDHDNDGVANSKDSCPNTPPGKTVDKNGCDCNYALNLNFGFDSAELTVGDKATLDALRAVLKDLGYAKATVAGHTDDRGEESYNQDLSQRRAQAVVDYLSAKGVNQDMLTPVGYGEAQPVESNGTDAGRAANRRVVIERTDCGK